MSKSDVSKGELEMPANENISNANANVADVLLIVCEQLEAINTSLSMLLNKPTNITIKQSDVSGASEDKPVCKQKAVMVPAVVSDEQISKYVAGVDPFTIVNTKSKFAYSRFVDWCRSQGVEPCTPNKFTARLVKHHNMKTCSEYIRPMSWQVGAQKAGA